MNYCKTKECIFRFREDPFSAGIREAGKETGKTAVPNDYESNEGPDQRVSVRKLIWGFAVNVYINVLASIF